MSIFSDWETFYVIVGGASGALIGLQFIVITLMAERPRPNVGLAGAAFSTPNIVHFSTVLAIAAILCAPWSSPGPAAFLWGAIGVAGALYSVLVASRMRAQTIHRPEIGDWVYYAALPLAAYLVLAGAALLSRWDETRAMLCVGGASLALLLVGIHNAWDTVSYHVYVNAPVAARQP